LLGRIRLLIRIVLFLLIPILAFVALGSVV
jgi:hypothetical protein